jgi:hypothetical protein
VLALDKQLAGQKLLASDLDFPRVEMGLQGVIFINKCVESSKKGSVWINI